MREDLTEPSGKAMQRPDGTTERAHQYNGLAYEWIYWELRKNGEYRLAEAVGRLLMEYRFAVSEWHEERALRRETVERCAKHLDARAMDPGRGRMERHTILCCSTWVRDLASEAVCAELSSHVSEPNAQEPS